MLCIKIVVTLILIVLPLLLLSKQRLEAITKVAAQDATLFRLYGVALLALLISYGAGLIQAFNAVYPLSVLLMGVVSNGGAAMFLLRSSEQKHAVYGVYFLP